MTKILFFTTALEHSTFRKTAKMLASEGASVHIIGFTRNNFPAGAMDGVSVECIGTLSHGNYFKRLFVLVKFLFVLRRRAGNFDVIYNFTLDTLLMSKIALLFRRKIWVYQIQDIRSIYFGTKVQNYIARWTERFFLRYVDILVISSINYFTEFYKKRYGFPIAKVHVIENKLIKGSINPAFQQGPQGDKIKVGYFGVMRCIRSWNILKGAATIPDTNLSLYMRGRPVSIPTIESEIMNVHNIIFGGAYRSPDDLNELYNSVDVVWACYPYPQDVQSENWKLARTIRFYEACAFGKPVIVQKGTAQEQEVLKYNIGMVVDMADPIACMSQLKSIDDKMLTVWKKNIKDVPSSFYYHDKEYKTLLEKINKRL